MGLFDAFSAGHSAVMKKTMGQKGLVKGDHLRNCERCNYCVTKGRKLMCTAHGIRVAQDTVCNHFSR